MITFGRRIKDLRKGMGMSQAELAARLGVSIQTVSRWECDSGMPDIMQIVPLAKTLGTTTDILLGMDSSEKDDISDLESELNKAWRRTTFNNTRDGEKYEEVVYGSYKKYRELYKRYPSNFSLALDCASCASDTLAMANIYHRLVLEEKEAKGIFTDAERMINTVIRFDSNYARKLKAKQLLIQLYCNVRNFEKAQIECDDLDLAESLESKIIIAGARDEEEDREDKITLAKDLFEIRQSELFASLYHLARAYSVFGKEKRNEALEVYNMSLSLLETLNGAENETAADSRRAGINMLIAKEYLRDGDYEKCLDYVENTTDACIDYLRSVRKRLYDAPESSVFLRGDINSAGSIEDKKEFLRSKREQLKWTIIACWEECGTDDNVITQSDRYKKCTEKYDSETDIILDV